MRLLTREEAQGIFVRLMRDKAMRACARILLIATCCLVSACSNAQSNEQDKTTAFWNWFKQHETVLSKMAGPNDPIFPEIGNRIKEIDQALAFEIGPAPDNKKEFAVSADCRLELFPVVKKVVAAAPPLKNWTVVAFRQRTPPSALQGMAIAAQTQDTNEAQAMPGLAVSEMRYALKRSGDKADVVIYLKNYKGQQPLEFMANMILQQAIGEYDLVTKINDVSFKPIDKDSDKSSKPFVKMAAELDQMFKSTK
jgi:hypothetical protein